MFAENIILQLMLWIIPTGMKMKNQVLSIVSKATKAFHILASTSLEKFVIELTRL